MLNDVMLDFLKRISKALAELFGSDCEIAIHDLTTDNLDHTIIHIENGNVSNRKIGDGPSPVVLKALKENPDNLKEDRKSVV